MANDLVTSLVYWRKSFGLRRISYLLLKLLGVEIPLPVVVGDNLEIVHSGYGIVVHRWTRIGNRVKIYPGVTIGRSDIHRPIEDSRFKGVVIEDDVILSAGCKILGKDDWLTVGRGTIIGANAVLLCSTGENEIWAGIPARKIGMREPPV